MVRLPLASLAGDRPRAVVVAGMGGSGIAADVAAAVAGRTCPVPCCAAPRATGCPAGSARWTSSSPCPARAAPRRRCRPPTRRCAAAPGWSRSARPARRSPRAATAAARCTCGSTRTAGCRGRTCGASPSRCSWCSTPSGSPTCRGTCCPALADELDRLAERCAPGGRQPGQPREGARARSWPARCRTCGEPATSRTSRRRALAAQLAENAKYPAVHGPLTEVHHNQVVVMAGVFGALAADGADDDIFRDRVDDGPAWPRMRLLVLRDTDEVPEVAAPGRRVAPGRRAVRRARAASCAPRASTRCPRLASLVAPLDFATRLPGPASQGIDPSPDRADRRPQGRPRRRAAP